ncbi:glycoside hydrolase family 2 TIM barrel-domain containing protein [Pedobacter chinensis]|uniref:glycoside hydrolase family 2 TIM barrel-domain containing protein n=1 Tax=Pedobacter chinensis TaxID=2282421 RepID=UPI001314CE46|nr:glycoside hydrolase family 2 TIM barrel-domain containing protein [Pedobacter chinensis]
MNKPKNLAFQIFSLCVLTLLISSHTAFAQRIKQSINTSWQFHKGEDLDTASLGYWQNINLSHTWNSEDVMDDTPGYYRGIGFYKKDIYIADGAANKDVYLYFEGAGQLAELFVNGQSVGKHIGGYSPFSFNMTKVIKRGKNTVFVKVDNSYHRDIAPLGGDFSVYGGIYRDVYLVTLEKAHFDMDNYASSGIFITTPQVSAQKASVSVKGKVSSFQKNLKVKTIIYDADGRIISNLTSDINADGSFSAVAQSVTNPKLWTPENPYLYRVVNSIIDIKSGKKLDEVTNPLGFRWFSFDAEKGFFLNGNPYKIMGASRHQDYKGLGSALPDALHINDVQQLKEMGGNFLRVSHYPQDPAIMEACDRLGILVSVETPGNNQITENEAYSTNMLEMQREMIRQNFNHPSVIIWSYMNEVLIQPLHKENTPEREQYWKNLRKLAQELEDLCRKEDPARYTMVAFHGDFELYKRVGFFDIPMISGWNLYQGWYVGKFEDFETFVLRYHREYPDKPIIISEFGADADYRLHDFNPSRFDKTQEYANQYHEAYIKTITKYPFIAGGIVWNLVEFVNEARQDANPHLNTKGLLTADRKAKDSYFIYKALLAKEHVVKISGSSWDYRAQQADRGSDIVATQPVTIFSNQKEVTLWLNHQKISTQEVVERKAVFNVPFLNGINNLKAVADDGMEDNTHVNFHVIANNLKNKTNQFTTLNVSLGDKRMFMDEVTGESWVPEKEYSSGNWGYIGGSVFKDDEKSDRYGSWRNVLGTPYDAIYQTQRIGLQEFKADVPDGFYEVTFHFAELLTKEQQQKLIYDLAKSNPAEKNELKSRSFNVSLNGINIIENLSDENYLKPIHAYSTKFSISVTDNKGISIAFDPAIGSAILNALQIRKIY